MPRKMDEVEIGFSLIQNFENEYLRKFAALGKRNEFHDFIKI